MIELYILIGILVTLCIVIKEEGHESSHIDSETGEKLIDIED